MMGGWADRQALIEQLEEDTASLIGHADRVRREWRPKVCGCGHTAGEHVTARGGLSLVIGTCLRCECEEFDDQ